MQPRVAELEAPDRVRAARVEALEQRERFVAEPEAAVQRICAFLEEPFEPEMLRWFQKDEAVKD